MSIVTVREYARLTTEPGVTSMDRATISSSALHWLIAQSYRQPSDTRVLQIDGPHSLKVSNYVGIIETPCGTQIEIVPKYVEGPQAVSSSRGLLTKMISEALKLKPRTLGIASIETFKVPLTEWVAAQFLRCAADLIKRGLRQSYLRVEACESFLRGRLALQRQVRGRPGRAHAFEIEHDIFTFDRPENRILRSALDRVLASTRVAENWRLARELALLLWEIPGSTNVAADLHDWGHDRLLAHYSTARPWCELILTNRMPFAVAGATRGPSMLFPMQRLFEEYVLASVRAQLPAGFRVKAQAREEHLCSYLGANWFELRPDIIIDLGATKWVMDTKWKLLTSSASENFGLSSSDLYQMFTYGQKYLKGVGDLYLVYPQTERFPKPRGPFLMSESLRLHVVPFDLEARRFSGIRWMTPDGDREALTTLLAHSVSPSPSGHWYGRAIPIGS